MFGSHYICFFSIFSFHVFIEREINIKVAAGDEKAEYAIEPNGRIDSLGTISKGKIADIVAVDGDPLEDITVLEDVDFVMKEGKVYKSP